MQLAGGMASWVENGRLSCRWPQFLSGHSADGRSLAETAFIHLVSRYPWAAHAWLWGQWSHSPPQSPCELTARETLRRCQCAPCQPPWAATHSCVSCCKKGSEATVLGSTGASRPHTGSIPSPGRGWGACGLLVLR